MTFCLINNITLYLCYQVFCSVIEMIMMIWSCILKSYDIYTSIARNWFFSLFFFLNCGVCIFIDSILFFPCTDFPELIYPNSYDRKSLIAFVFTKKNGQKWYFTLWGPQKGTYMTANVNKVECI